MLLTEIVLRNYRNYDDQTFLFGHHSNLVIGNNGKGKSNLVEAIHFLSYTKSLKTNCNQDVIRFDQDYAVIEAMIQNEAHHHAIDIQFNSSGKQIKLNGKQVVKSTDILTLFQCLFITSDDHRIFTTTPQERRRYLDSLLSKLDTDYMGAITNLKRIVKQKNNLYKQEMAEKREVLRLFHDELLKYHQQIIEKRIAYLTYLQHQMNMYIHEFLLPVEKFDVDIQYHDTVHETPSAEWWLQRESQYKESLFGAHRDDFTISLSGKDLKKYMSLGEKQLIALICRMSEKDYMQEKKNVSPVIVIDDAWLGLDESRKRLFQSLLTQPLQKIITSTTRTSDVWRERDIETVVELS